MYYLGIVLAKDINDGYINAEYVLCKSLGRSKNRSPYRVYRYGNPTFFSIPRILFPIPYCSNDLIDFLSNYRTRDHIHIKGRSIARTKKYTPVGALFWFECNKYGEPTGKKIFIKRIPDKKYSRDNAKNELMKKIERKRLTVNELLKDDVIYETEEKRIKLTQRKKKG